METEFKFDKLEVVEIKPTDTVILHVPQRVTMQQREQIITQLRHAIGQQVRCLVIDSGMQMSVVRHD